MNDISKTIALKVENLKKSFGTFQAINDISLSIYKGEIFGFLGPNGAGKTTTIKMLSGLLKPDSGKIKIDGDYKSIGVCPQNIVIWDNLTCLEQLVFMGEMYGISNSKSKKRALELLESLGLTSKMNKLSKTLSGGMQRRMNIALALIHNPEILILDEPQAGLDPQSRILVREYISSIKSKVTIILTTHDMEEAEKLSDRVCIIDYGKVLIVDTVDEIKKNVGTGDIIEIELDGKNPKEEILPHLKQNITLIKNHDDNTLSFISDNSQESIFEAMTIIKSNGLSLKNFKMRDTSLEDVFINLTGRRLRE